MTDTAASLLNALPLPAVLIAEDERIGAANPAAKTMVGQNPEGRHFITVFRQPTLTAAVETCLRTGQDTEAEFHTNAGQSEIVYQVSIRAVTMDRPAVLLTFEDVSSLRRAGEARRDFVANVSHELRTPLTSLMGFIETLKGPARGDLVAQDRFLAIMEQETQRMNRLVGDLLSLSRVEENVRVRPKTLVDPAVVISAALDGLAPLAHEAGVRLDRSLPESAFAIHADPDQLRQVMNNLLENAVKYAGSGSVVTVSLSTPAPEPSVRGDGVRIVVSDTGPGIAAHHIPRLTERFYRADAHRSRDKGGTGLGLAIVKHIVDRHRGRLRIASTLGQGSTFTVILPV